MKRRPCDESDGADPPEEPSAAKKLREEAGEGGGGGGGEAEQRSSVPELGEDAIYEVLRRADARTLAAAACVSRRWRRLAADERLWEAACVRHWEAARDYGGARLRPVVLALGGFRRLHSLYLAPLLRPPQNPSPPPPPPPPIAAAAADGAAPPISPAPPPPIAVAAAARGRGRGTRWGRDEVQLSLSLLSIGFFERMSAGEYKGGGGGGGGGGDGRG